MAKLEDYVTLIGSDFVDVGHRVAQWLEENANGKTKIIEIEGTAASSSANDRKKGFDDYQGHGWLYHCCLTARR